jgi:GNAT superfamily N-acetyltransferase
MPLKIVRLSDRPELLEPLESMETSWPEFMLYDPMADVYFARRTLELFSDYILVGLDADGEVAAKGYSIPVPDWDDDFPEDGWDGVVVRGLMGKLASERPDVVSAIEISIRPDLQGRGHSGRMLAAMVANTRDLGFNQLVAPVRPSGKTDVHEPMERYARSTRDDGLPLDPWLRVHVRAGGTIERVATRSMVIPGTLAEWRERTGLAFERSGPVEVPGALAPVICDVDHGTAVYVEPNVWVRHRV